MAITKGTLALITSQALAPGAAGVNSGWKDATELQAVTVYARVNNDSGTNTSRPTILIEVADDASGTNAREVYFSTTTTVDTSVSDRRHLLDITARHFRVTIVNPAANSNNVTVDAHAQTVTALG